MNPAGARRGALFVPVLLLGLLADLLFRTDAPGLNLPAWITVLAGSWVWHRRRSGEVLGQAEWQLLGVMVALGAATAWRATPMLILLDLFGIGVTAGLLPVAAAGPDAWASLTPGGLVRAATGFGVRGVTGALPVVAEASLGRPGSGAVALPVARGLLIVAPLLLLFGLLLGSADRVFGDFLQQLIRVEPDRVASHVFGIAAGCWAGAAVLRGAGQERLRWPVAIETSVGRGLGPIELGMVLGLLDLLFAAFIAFQVPYLFGGPGWVARTAGVTLAEYAREGFFQLVMVSALVLPLLLVTGWKVDAAQPRAMRLYRSLAGIMVMLLLAIMASATHRMALYTAEFGLTVDRFFASAGIAGLAVTALWFPATALRGEPARFARGSLLAWGGWLLTLNLVNPERVIVEQHLQRAAAGHEVDASYLARLGADAVPTLVRALPTLPAAARDTLLAGMLRRAEGEPVSDFRSWNYGRARAQRLLATLPTIPAEAQP